MRHSTNADQCFFIFWIFKTCQNLCSFHTLVQYSLGFPQKDQPGPASISCWLLSYTDTHDLILRPLLSFIIFIFISLTFTKGYFRMATALREEDCFSKPTLRKLSRFQPHSDDRCCALPGLNKVATVTHSPLQGKWHWVLRKNDTCSFPDPSSP